ncbi:hypothetical protein D9D46_02800 [Escherichia coli]|nr:hypothetical protein [Escherichia coli]EFN7404431.1 hypothetical protein [Escherichia coli]RNJ36205.1 hypothetical protein EFR80_13345 [Escherichia coli]
MPPGAWRRLYTRRVGIHRRSTVSLNLNPRALSRIHHNAKDSLWLKILSCYVPAFSHIRRGGPGYSPTTRIRLIWLSPTTQKEKKCPVISIRCTNPTVKMLESIGALKSVG